MRVCDSMWHALLGEIRAMKSSIWAPKPLIVQHSETQCFVSSFGFSAIWECLATGELVWHSFGACRDRMKLEEVSAGRRRRLGAHARGVFARMVALVSPI